MCLLAMEVERSRCTSACKARIQRALAHRVPATQPRQEPLEAEPVTPVRRCAIPATRSLVFSKIKVAEHGLIRETLTSSGPYTNSTALDRCPPSYTPPAVHRSRPSSCYRPRSRPHQASGNPRSPSRASRTGLSSCKTP